MQAKVVGPSGRKAGRCASDELETEPIARLDVALGVCDAHLVECDDRE